MVAWFVDSFFTFYKLPVMFGNDVPALIDYHLLALRFAA